MLRRFLAVSLCLLALTVYGLAQTKKPAMKKSPAGPAPDKALMQKIWDGWSTLDPATVEKYYARGPHTFFDIAPLKYGSWEEYEKTSKTVLAGYKSAKFLVLLLALVVKNQDLRAAAFFHNLADYPRIRLLAYFALFAGNCQHRELHQPVATSAHFLHSNYIPGRHPVLLSTGADNRVHTSASVECG